MIEHGSRRTIVAGMNGVDQDQIERFRGRALWGEIMDWGKYYYMDSVRV